MGRPTPKQHCHLAAGRENVTSPFDDGTPICPKQLGRLTVTQPRFTARRREPSPPTRSADDKPGSLLNQGPPRRTPRARPCGVTYPTAPTLRTACPSNCSVKLKSASRNSASSKSGQPIRAQMSQPAVRELSQQLPCAGWLGNLTRMVKQILDFFDTAENS